jgi:cell division protein FtsI (penicillin-binding protein 3)
VTVETDSVFVRPHRIKEPQKAAVKLAESLGLEQGFIEHKLKSNRPFVWIKRQVRPEESEAVRALNFEGVGMIQEPDRNYPYGRLGGPLLGYTGVDLQGLAGIEAMYEKELRGEGGTRVGERDALGNALYPDGIVFEGTSKGRSIRLTVDAKVQYYADSALAEAYRKTRAEAACAIVMQPHTGEILAVSALPGFDPNMGRGYKRNIAVTDVFEVGSTFKPFVMAAALEQNAISADEMIHCQNGEYKFGGSIIHDDHSHAELSPAEIIKVSSNIGITKVAVRLGARNWYSALRSYGFGDLTGSRLPNESAGILRPVEKWRRIDLATTSFGQGIGVTPLQLITAFSSLVNGGNLMRPRLVSGLYDESGRVVERIDPGGGADRSPDRAPGDIQGNLPDDHRDDDPGHPGGRNGPQGGDSRLSGGGKNWHGPEAGSRGVLQGKAGFRFHRVRPCGKTGDRGSCDFRRPQRLSFREVRRGGRCPGL